MKKNPKKKAPSTPVPDTPRVHPDLQGFNIQINAFGEIVYSHSVDQINQFLNKKVVDQKLKNRLGFKTDEDDDTVEFMY